MFRAFRLRAILFPLGVAIASITAVAWYGLIKIPSQQRYITDRNLRLLKTKAAQIKAKVDNLDVQIDNALDFYPRASDRDAATFARELQRYVRRFAPGLEILSDDDGDAVRSMREKASDPPNVTVLRDEGRNYLYLGYNHNNQVIVARVDLEKAVAPFLSSDSEFDALLLVTRDGSVIAQQSSAGLELAHVDGLRPSTPPPSGDVKNGAAPTLFASMWKSTNVENVILGNAEYQLYVQPLQLSLATSDDKKVKGQEEWALCGLVRADHFRSAGSAISATYLLWFGAALATVCLAIPLLKLHILSPTERFRSVDGVFVAVTAFAAAGLVTFCAVDAYYFSVEVNDRGRKTLSDVAHAIGERFRDETRLIAAQMKELQETSFWTTSLAYPTAEVPPNLHLAKYPADRFPTTIEFKDHFLCTPSWACRDNILVKTREQFKTYPFFDNVMWLDEDGWQRIKWSVNRVTPLLNVAQQPYFQELKTSRMVSTKGDGSGISVLQSRNTGEVLTIFWKTLGHPFAPERGDNAGTKRDENDVRLIGEALVTTPISLIKPVVPSHVQFVVIDSTGRVMFHTDPTRSLRENFFVECEDNPELRSAVSGRHSRYLNASYFAHTYTLYVTPLDVTAFGDPGWTLVVLGDRSVVETLNLETLAASALMFGLYGAVLAAAWALLAILRPQLVRKWFWPDRPAYGAYRRVMIVNGALAVLFFAGIARLTSAALLASTAVLVAVSFVSTYLLVTRARPAAGSTAGWEAFFHGARASLLLVVAAVPAVACFLTAYNFEMTLFARSRVIASATQLETRNGRIKARAAKNPLCPAGQTADTCDAIEKFIEDRKVPHNAARPWDVAVPLPEQREPASTEAPAVTYLDAFLAAVHRPYNDIAVELAAVLPTAHGAHDDDEPGHRWREWIATGDPATVALAEAPGSTKTLSASVLQAQPSLAIWLVAAGLSLVLYVLVSVVVRPLYLIDLHGVRTATAADVAFDRAGHLLLVGPPGSGKTARLVREERIRLFDARTRAFVDRRTAPRLSLSEIEAPYAFAGGPHGFPWPEAADDDLDDAPPPPVDRKAENTNGEWLDASMLPSDPAAPVGVDHLEYSLDDPVDRPKMLRFLETLVYQHQRTVCAATTCDPIRQLRELGDRGPDAAEMARWIRVFQSFREQPIGPTRRHIGEPYFRAVWSSCSRIEQLVLRQLADEGVVNPRSEGVLERLMRSGLVARDRTIHIADGAFRRFVQTTMSADEVSRREGDGVALPWASITAAAVTVALGLGALLVLTSQQMVDAWIGYVPALAPAVPTVLKLLGSARTDAKAGPANA